MHTTMASKERKKSQSRAGLCRAYVEYLYPNPTPISGGLELSLVIGDNS